MVEPRVDSHSDVLSEGAKLYIASHEFKRDGSELGDPSFFYRYSYNTVTDSYSLDFAPIQISNFSTEALTIDKDSTGKIWAAWTQDLSVHITHSTTSDSTWLPSSFILPATDPIGGDILAADDICALTRFGGNKIGVLWSDQTGAQSTWSYKFTFHVDGAPDNAWSAVETIADANLCMGDADDHINFATHAGNIYVAGKNACNEILLLVRASNGTWTRKVVWQPNPDFTRPIVLLSSIEPQGEFFVPPQLMMTIRVFATKLGTGFGEVFEKTSSINNISFPAGDGTLRLRDTLDLPTEQIEDCTSTRQIVSNSTGWVVLAHHVSSGFYWHHDVAPQ